jgi:hypothetical protein
MGLLLQAKLERAAFVGGEHLDQETEAILLVHLAPVAMKIVKRGKFAAKACGLGGGPYTRILPRSKMG